MTTPYCLHKYLTNKRQDFDFTELSKLEMQLINCFLRLNDIIKNITCQIQYMQNLTKITLIINYKKTRTAGTVTSQD